MAIVVTDRGANANQGATSATYSYTTNAAVTAGNSLIVIASFQGGIGATTWAATPISSSPANTWGTEVTHTVNNVMGIFRADNCASGSTTITITADAASLGAIAVLEVSGLANPSSDSKTAGNSGTVAAMSTGTTASTTQAVDLVVAGATTNSNTTSVTYSSGYTAGPGMPNTTLGGDIYSAYLVTAASGTQTCTFTANSAGGWDAVIACFKGATVASDPYPLLYVYDEPWDLRSNAVYRR